MKMFKKKLWKIWQIFLVLSIPTNILLFILGACFLDSDSLIPGIVCAVSGCWLLWLTICNERSSKNKREEYIDEISIKDVSNF